MRNSTLLLLALLLGPTPGAAQIASLVADIEPEAGQTSSDPAEWVALERGVSFCARVPELFKPSLHRTDGTDVGTRRLSEDCPFSPDFAHVLLPTEKVPALVIWTRLPLGRGQSTGALWRSDGSVEGTFPLTSPGEEAIVLQWEPGRAYFVKTDSDETWSLWSTDGTPRGTRRILDVATPTSQLPPAVLGFLSDAVLVLDPQPDFSSTLRRVPRDGGPTTTVRAGLAVSDFPYRPLGRTRLYFRNVVANREEVWTTDGTTAGTRSVARFQAEFPFASNALFATVGDRLYFTATNDGPSEALWATDGGPPRRLLELGSAQTFGTPVELVGAIDGRALLRIASFDRGWQLWASNGTASTTELLLDVCPEGCTADRGGTEQPVQLADRLFFFHRTAESGVELWTSDGTRAGTRQVVDLCPGPCGAGRNLVALGDELLFTAFEPRDGFEIWATNRDGDAPVRLTQLSSSEAFDFLPAARWVARRGDDLIFRGVDDLHGLEPWVTSPDSPEGARLITDLGGWQGGLQVDFLTALGNRLLFQRHESTSIDGISALTLPGASLERLTSDFFENCAVPPRCRLDTLGGRAFWLAGPSSSPETRLLASDGSAAGTVPVFEPSATRTVQGILGIAGSRLAFAVADSTESTNPVWIWTTDGTPAGTQESPANEFLPLGERTFVGAAGNRLWLVRRDRTQEPPVAELWTMDGGPAAPLYLEELPPSLSPFAFPQVAQVGERVVYSVPREDGRFELWGTDGSPGNARRLNAEDGPRWSSLDLTGAIPGGDRLWFLVSQLDGTALWVTDGTVAGTRQVQTLESDPTFESGFEGTALGNRLVFTTFTAGAGEEIWATDGTNGRLLRDIRPGPRGSRPSGLEAAGGRVWFSADDGVHGSELWSTDGTPEGTRLVHDLFPGPQGSLATPSSNGPFFTQVTDRLYFLANDGLSGYELWSLPLTPASPVCADAPNGLCLQGNRFRAEVAWQDFAGNRGVGQPAAITADTGYFWFFDPGNIEIVAKQLDGRALNDHFWTFYAALSNVEYHLTLTDTETGLTRRFFNPPGLLASVADTESFGPRGADLASFTAPAPAEGQAAVFEAAASFAPRAASGTCTPSATTLCLADGRFAVEVAWTDFQGNQGTGQTRTLTGDTGAFWFFAPDNVEVVLKVLDGTALNGKFWVFYGALSNVEYRLTVTDTTTGTAKTYTNPSGRLASVADTGAF